jgi:hypothetical protein
MRISELLNTLDFGNQVAEFDRDSDDHFIITDAFRAIVENRSDIVAGDKGAGKTTIYKYLNAQYTQIPQLSKVEVISGFNPSGSPVFSRLTRLERLSEAEYLYIWKTYILSLIGNWLLHLCEGSYGNHTNKLSDLLNRMGLRSNDDKAEGVFTRLIGLKHKLFNPKNIGMEISLDPLGNPKVRPSIEFNKTNDEPAPELNPIIDDTGLILLNQALAENDITVWVLLDRLDEAFVGYPEFEIPILRALLRAYLDLLAYERLGVKLFVRKDLFRKVIKDGFVNLTHVNARKVEIIWEKEDLISVICRRIKGSKEFIRLCGVQIDSDQRIFESVFPPQMESGGHKLATWDWIASQIRDGNGVVAPRNLVELAILAKEEQGRREQRKPRYFSPGQPIIEPDSLLRASARLSVHRVQDTLMAEASREVAALIAAFKDGKRGHNDESIGQLFGVSPSQAHEFAATLLDIGFLENAGKRYRVAPLYRDGINTSRGKTI